MNKNSVSNVCLVGCMITQRLKSTFFEKFSSLRVSESPLGTLLSEKCQKMLILGKPFRQTVHCPAKMNFSPRFS